MTSNWIGFDYASAKTRDRIEAILDDMWATGDLLENEHYRIEQRKYRSEGKAKSRWYIVLPME